MRVDLHPEARGEFGSAAFWYEERRDGLGDEFVAAVGEVLERIGEAPERFPRWPSTERGPAVIRKATVKRFPYLIAFERDENRALVLAVEKIIELRRLHGWAYTRKLSSNSSGRYWIAGSMEEAISDSRNIEATGLPQLRR